MNVDEEMTLDTATDAAVENPESPPQGDSESAGADNTAAQEQQIPAEEQDGSESENEADNGNSSDDGDTADDSNESDDGDAFDDDYDSFYHDMSEIERDLKQTDDSEEDEGGDTTTDPEGEDGDEGENEDENTEEQANEEQTGAAADGGADETSADNETDAPSGAVADYAAWESEDRAAILKAYPELEGALKGKHLSEVLDDPGLFGYMRGTAEARAKYSAVDAFEKASAKLIATRAAASKAKQNSKQHLKSSSGKAATASGAVPPDVMKQARELFPGKTRAEIEKLYKNVT